MKIAVVYNRESQEVINVFGQPNLERYGKKSIARIATCLKNGGHQVRTFEGDKNLIDRLEEFMPRVVKGERPGMVFNLAYGIQGQARYTHVPGILEMVGLPYVGSGPMAHSLALDKVVAKMLFVQHGLPTPEFAVLETRDFSAPDLQYPLIVKPRNEAVSMGIKIVHDEGELRSAAEAIFDTFHQAVLVERYIEGREINVGLLGNNPVEALPPAELLFGDGPRIYTIEDKKHKSGRIVEVACPAELDEATVAHAQDLALRAFRALGCSDCARVDMRMDEEGKIYILEINSLPSLGEHGSYVQGAQATGLDFCGLVNRLVEVAGDRYFGNLLPPEPQTKKRDPQQQIFSFLTGKRDAMEGRLRDWTSHSSRTSDPIGIRTAFRNVSKTMDELGLTQVEAFSDEPVVQTWQTKAGLEGGTLVVSALDVPLPLDAAPPTFRRDPEWLHGEGIASSRAPLVMTEFALRALRTARKLTSSRLGVLLYADEGLDCTRSSALIERACSQVKQVLVLRPGSRDDSVITGRRGLRHYSLTVDSQSSRRLGQAIRKPEVLRWLWNKLDACCALSSRSDRVAVSVGDLKTSAYRMLLPHRVQADLMVGFPDLAAAERLEAQLREILGPSRNGYRWSMELVADRPPMPERRSNRRLRKLLKASAEHWNIAYREETSLLPSIAGLVPPDIDVMCGLGPAAIEIYTAHEAIRRISFVERTLLLSQAILDLGEEN